MMILGPKVEFIQGVTVVCDTDEIPPVSEVSTKTKRKIAIV